MSKDAKIGFAIGGVLLAVLVVYLVVVPRHHRVSHPPVAVVTPPAGTAPVSPAPGESTSLAETPTTAPTVADKPFESVTPLVPAAGSTFTPPLAGAPAGQLAEATNSSAALAGNGDWNKLFPSQSGGTSLMASDPSPTLSHTGSPVTPGSVINSGSSTGADIGNDQPAVHNTAADPSRHSRHADSGNTDVAGTGRPYTVRSGETFSSIAAAVYGNSRYYLAIMKANPAINPNRLKVGTKLSLPASADVKPLVTAAADTGTGESTAADEPAAGYESGGPAGGGIILASSVTPQTETIVSSDSNGFYTVKKGDTLYGISKKLYGNLHEATVLYSMNQSVIGPDKAKLKVGTVLQLPSTGAVEAAANGAQ